MASVQQAVTALQLLAVNDRLKSVCISGAIGSGKSQLLTLYEEFSGRPRVVIPTHVTVDRLYGGISLDETLQQQRIVYEQSLFERTMNGHFIVEQLERFDPMIARTIVKAVEEQAIQLTRDEVIDYQLQHTGLYTTQALEQLPQTLADCIALTVTLEAPTEAERVIVLKNEWRVQKDELKEQVLEARKLLPNVTMNEEKMYIIAELLKKYQLQSTRAHYAWIQAARALAALQKECVVTEQHIYEVAQYVLNHRTDLEPPQPEAPPSTSQNEMDQPEPQQREGEDVLVDVEAQEQGAMSLQLDEMAQTKKALTGKASEHVASKKRGRQIGTEPYKKAQPDLDFLATLRRAIPEQPLYENSETAITVKPHHFINKKREQKQAQHIIFVVDASQSMHQQEQMTAVKGVVLSLLKDAYQKRNVVSFISMYQQQAEVQLHASKNIGLARQTLQNLKVGGKTPLASALALSQSIVQTSTLPIEATKVIILTDGRANVTLAGEKHVKQALADSIKEAENLRQLGVQTLVVDTEQGNVKLQKAKQLADTLQGHYIKFSDFSNMKTYQFIRNGG